MLYYSCKDVNMTQLETILLQRRSLFYCLPTQHITVNIFGLSKLIKIVNLVMIFKGYVDRLINFDKLWLTLINHG